MNIATGHRLIIMINNISPYKEELINVLALPEGAQFRFRYQRKYAPTITDYKGMSLKKGTIVLRNRETAQFMPLRICEVLSANIVGDIIHLTVSLGMVAALADNDRNRNAQLGAFTNLLTQSIGEFPNSPNEDLENVVFYEDGRAYSMLEQWRVGSSDSELRHWGTCVRLMALTFSMKDLAFIRIVGLTDKSGRDTGFAKVSRTDGGYTLHPNSEYTLTVLQRTYTGRKGDSAASTERYLELKCNTDALSVLWDKEAILGKIDVIEYPIRTASQIASSATQMFLIVTDGTKKSLPPLKIPLRIKPSRWSIFAVVGRMVMFTLFLISYVASELISQHISGWLGSPLPFGIDKVAVIGMIFMGLQLGGLGKDFVASLKLGIK